VDIVEIGLLALAVVLVVGGGERWRNADCSRRSCSTTTATLNSTTS
jgi:uridylate kinase